MPSRRSVLAATLGGLALTATPALAAESRLKSLVDSQHARLAGFQTAAIGAFRGRDQYAVNGDTIFQIGSITKTFTGVALATAVCRGRVSLDDRLTKHLPGFPVSEAITLKQLATHTSGLPRLPTGLLTDPALDVWDPYAHITEAKLIEYLRMTQLIAEPGSKYEYSNLGAGLLGMALNRDYGTMVRDWIARPLRLKDTGLTVTDPRRKVQGYYDKDMPVPDWHMSVLQGMGALYGTVNDLLRFTHAHIKDPSPALKLAQRQHFTDGTTRVGLGWHFGSLPRSGEIIWHNGGTGGFSSYTAFSPSRRTGVAAIVNRFNAADEAQAAAVELLEAL
ncbi:CubicO group peptidase (beta-lactamase class C family) [Kibdelosporangium banguiense]|uniref:CubicO group peptidase (Beta-lactamase class C family) n=1 Tax=Kibdelosporangium banguiense TaxID=1365924 RepID=A0ABS4TFQ7_9PSEU|nr:serine hydrolase domain-containing protein [Kibdelosporangium banguiense]MBP2322703.1 CubicO group peptidase (beta-lactamase class C family) [Kibdelosporangium banguiense]